MSQKNQLSLKWGTLKSWEFTSEKGLALLKEYEELGWSAGAMRSRDTPRQKGIICELIDLCDEDKIYLHWDGKYVTKEEAKKYVMEYPKE